MSEKRAEDMPANTSEERIAKALAIAMQSGGVDGAHHKTWVIDQMVRALTGCHVVCGEAVDANGRTYVFKSQGRSEEYVAWVLKHNRPEGGDEDEYTWDEGIAP